MKKVKITTIILAIILITLIAFAGLYIKTQNRMEDKVKSYELGRALYGGRVVDIKVADGEGDGETKPNPETLTEENYETVKNTIEKRLENLGVQDYTISLDKTSGKIRIELTEDEITDDYIYYITALGNVQLKEKDTETELLSDSMIKECVYSYYSNPEGAYQVYLELELTKEGQAKIEELKNNYAILAEEVQEVEASQPEEDEEESSEEENPENQEETDNVENAEAGGEEPNTENQENTKKIAELTIGGNQYEVQKIEKNKIRINIGGETTNSSSINNNIAAAAELALLINSGKYPIQYEIESNRFIYSDITNKQILYFVIIVAVLIFISLIVLIIKYKINGLLASMSFIGFMAIFSLIIRYTNVVISIEGIGAILLILAINYVLNYVLLGKLRIINTINEVITNTYKETFLKLIPVIIISLVFCFARWANLSSFGMIMFWGLVLMAVYNIIVTKTLLKLRESK